MILVGHKCYCHSETSGQVPKEDLHCYNRPPTLDSFHRRRLRGSQSWHFHMGKDRIDLNQ